jgi:hypothetical protein
MVRYTDLMLLSEYLILAITELRACDHMMQKLPSMGRPMYLAMTKVFQGWKDSWSLIAKKNSDWVPKKTLPQEELDRVLG